MIDDPTFQKYAAIALVVAAAAWLVRRVWMRRKRPGCGDGRGCPAEGFGKRLRK